MPLFWLAKGENTHFRAIERAMSREIEAKFDAKEPHTNTRLSARPAAAHLQSRIWQSAASILGLILRA